MYTAGGASAAATALHTKAHIAVKDFLDRISNGNDKRQTLNLLHATWAADIHHDIVIHKITASDCI